MPELALILICFSAIIWLVTILLPWQAWRTSEALETADTKLAASTDLSDVTVLIPARNEAEVIAVTLAGLRHQGEGLQVVLVDDESNDGTANIAQQSGLPGLRIVQSQTLPSGWSGKLWAQEQGLAYVTTPLTLLLDADIELLPGAISALKHKRTQANLQMVSLMAVLRFNNFWEKLLLPSFVHFFKMIYPFALVNKPASRMAAAAGGCILIETKVLRDIGGMATIKDAIIDDCTLAKTVKQQGHSIWLGLTHAVISQRPYTTLHDIWEMVARTAFTQLFYSTSLLLLCTIFMLLMYILPVVALFIIPGVAFWLALLSMLLMAVSYFPTLNFYKLSPVWCLSMPLVASLYLLMTWTSAWRYWRGERSRWKGRVYQN